MLRRLTTTQQMKNQTSQSGSYLIFTVLAMRKLFQPVQSDFEAIDRFDSVDSIWLFFDFEAIDCFDFDDSIRLFLNLRQLIASISMTLFGFF